ncbi:hypothetical protein ScPMuIL_010751 [Solemya velum]
MSESLESLSTETTHTYEAPDVGSVLQCANLCALRGGVCHWRTARPRLSAGCTVPRPVPKRQSKSPWIQNISTSPNGSRSSDDCNEVFDKPYMEQSHRTRCIITLTTPQRNIFAANRKPEKYKPREVQTTTKNNEKYKPREKKHEKKTREVQTTRSTNHEKYKPRQKTTKSTNHEKKHEKKHEKYKPREVQTTTNHEKYKPEKKPREVQTTRITNHEKYKPREKTREVQTTRSTNHVKYNHEKYKPREKTTRSTNHEKYKPREVQTTRSTNPEKKPREVQTTRSKTTKVQTTRSTNHVKYKPREVQTREVQTTKVQTTRSTNHVKYKPREVQTTRSTNHEKYNHEKYKPREVQTTRKTTRSTNHEKYKPREVQTTRKTTKKPTRSTNHEKYKPRKYKPREVQTTRNKGRTIDCEDFKCGGSGVTEIQPNGSPEPFQVYCDVGGWIVSFQRRIDGSENFTRGWDDYEAGFGNLAGEFYLGNAKINSITLQGSYELRVDLSDFDGNYTYAHYSSFSVGDATTKYRLSVDGYSGTAGDSLAVHDNRSFSTVGRGQ